MNKIKVRVIGTRPECERILSQLKKREELIKCRKMDRSKEREKDPYNRIFGKAEYVFYIELKKEKEGSS